MLCKENLSYLCLHSCGFNFAAESTSFSSVFFPFSLEVSFTFCQILSPFSSFKFVALII